MGIVTPVNSFTVDDEISRLQSVLRELLGLRTALLAYEEQFTSQINRVHPAHEPSARNLVHYVALRKHDIRRLQQELTHLGLSSLGRSEAHIIDSLDRVLRMIRRAQKDYEELHRPYRRPVAFGEGALILERHTEALLGPVRNGKKVRILVTLATEAADDYAIVRDLVASGMDCARINCAHDSPQVWARMIKHLRRVERELRQSCRILMDLSGPKLRTGATEPGPRVLKCSPGRDECGRVSAPAHARLVPEEDPQNGPPDGEEMPSIPVPREWLSGLVAGQQIDCRDARGKKRALSVVASERDMATIEMYDTTYFTPGTRLVRRALPGSDEKACLVGDLPARETRIELHVGDLLRITGQDSLGRLARPAGPDGPAQCAQIPCTLPEIFVDVLPGERVWLDDGKIGGVIESASPEGIGVRITHAKPGGSRLRADKGINLPDSKLSVNGLTPRDIEHLSFVARHADVVGLSFVRGPEDVILLQETLARLRAPNLGIVLKIETVRALEKLPAVLMAAMRTHPIGVMIARGDLAVEIGYERLPEAQEEILALCEASHMPAIWATQVLENLTKGGIPSRAEVTDAAASVRAECVMLNKGPHILEAVRLLAGILKRMESHQYKKRALLGPLDMEGLS